MVVVERKKVKKGWRWRRKQSGVKDRKEGRQREKIKETEMVRAERDEDRQGEGRENIIISWLFFF